MAPRLKSKIVTGMEQALAHAQCDHQWIHKRSKDKTTLVRHCRKCGSRERNWGKPQRGAVSRRRGATTVAPKAHRRSVTLKCSKG